MSYPPPNPPPGAYPLPPARAPRRHRKWPWILLSVLALAILLAALAPHDVKVGSATDPGNGAPAPAATAKVGQKVHEGQFDLTVTSVLYSARPVGSVKAKGQWAVVTVKVTNVGQTPQTFYEAVQEAYVGTAKYTPDSGASFGLAVAGGGESGANEMGPGNSTVVKLPFDIPKGRHLTGLVLHESVGSDGVAVRP